MTLTRQGRRAYEEIAPDLTGFENALTERLGATASKELLAGLQKLETVLLGRRKPLA